jgi:hypothetical protein
LQLLIVDALGTAELDELRYLDAVVSGFEVTASLVLDSAGSSVNASGNSRGIGGPVDLMLLKSLRRQAQLVYTSGKTARAEGQIRPNSKDLAVLSKTPVAETFGPGTGKLLQVGAFEGADLVVDSALDGLRLLQKSGYQRVHCEFGVLVTTELLGSGGLDALFLSCESGEGADIFATSHSFEISARYRVGDLRILVVAGRG